MTDLIITKEKQGVFTIILNRIDKKNALNNIMYFNSDETLYSALYNLQLK